MAQLLEEQRESWGTRGGFILAAIGSAVGLGNLWGFPYKLYSYGGGAFLIPYIIAIFCIGVPMLILEFSIGHLTQRAAPDAFKKVNIKTEFVGWWGIILGFVIITYYPVILAYCLSYLKFSIVSIFTGQPLPWAGQGIEGVNNASDFFFNTYLKNIEGPHLGTLNTHIVIPFVITWVLMYLCIFKGVNLVGKIVWLTVPLPWLMLLVLTVRGLTLEGSMNGLVYYLDPDWSQLAKPTTWRFAFGQVFFSLSLAFGVMITYASFLHRKSDINNNAAIIGLADFATSFIAGLAIFATLGGMSFITKQADSPVAVDKVVNAGPGLAFVAFPYALAQLPGAPWWSLIFFLTLVTLGIDSAFSITESVLAGIVDKTGWPRSIVLPVMSMVGLLIGLAYVTRGGLNWIGAIDGFINGTWGIAFLGLLECLVLGWVYKIEILRTHANERSDWNLGKWWNYSVRIFIPIVLGTLFFWSLSDDMLNPEGFLKYKDGSWNPYNCIGMIVVALAPVIAIIMTRIKTAASKKEDKDQILQKPAKKQGSIALAIALASLLLMLPLFILENNTTMLIIWLIIAFLAILSIIISNYILDKYQAVKPGPHYTAKLAGICGVTSISIFITTILVHITKEELPKSIKPHTDHLSGVSYIILAVVSLVIVCGLGWCFYRAVLAAGKDEPQQLPEGEGQ